MKFDGGLDLNELTDEDKKEIENKDDKMINITFDRLILNKYSIDKDLEFQRFYKANKEFLHRLVHNKVKFEDLEFYEDLLPINIEDPLIGSTYDIFTKPESIIGKNYKNLLLQDKKTFLDNMNNSELVVGGHPIDICVIDKDADLYDYYAFGGIYIETKNEIKTLVFKELHMSGENLEFIGNIGISYNYIYKKYGLEDYKDDNDVLISNEKERNKLKTLININDMVCDNSDKDELENIRQYKNIRELVFDSMKLFVENALNLYYFGTRKFAALTLDINGFYFEDGVRKFIEEYFEFKPEFELFYNPASPDISKENALKNFKKHLKFTLILGKEFYENNAKLNPEKIKK